jgi:hypothetical protein
MVGCHRERLVKHRQTAVIWGMYAAPEHRRSRLKRRLFVATVERART